MTGINWDVFMEINARAAMRRLEAEKKATIPHDESRLRGSRAPLNITGGGKV